MTRDAMRSDAESFIDYGTALAGVVAVVVLATIILGLC